MQQNRQDLVELEITLSLPQPLAREAEINGLLTASSLESLLREELRRRRVDDLFDAADRLAAVPMPPLTASEVEAEIAAVRHERRSSGASGR